MRLFRTKSRFNHHLTTLLIALLTINAAATITSNLLCFNDSWNIIKGEWDFDPITCSLNNTDTGGGNIVWFGSLDGQTPDYRFDFDIFTLTAIIEIQNAAGYDAGIMFRTAKSSESNNEGPTYYIGLYPVDAVRFGEINNGWYIYSEPSYTIDPQIPYKLTVTASNSMYNVSVNGTTVINNLNQSHLTRGSIGIRTFYSPAIVHSLMYEAHIKLESCNTDNYYVRHSGAYSGLQMNVDDSSAQFDRDSTFILHRPGLVDDIDYITLQETNVAGEYVARHAYYNIVLDPVLDEITKWDASFTITSALNGDTDCISLQSFNYPTYYFTHDHPFIRIIEFVDNTTYKDDASFRIQNFKVPTPAPTTTPTHNPTYVPTQNPTIYPTIDPTIDPTTDPSNAPTFAPSQPPSLAPTSSPSLAPTSSPTTCYEQDDVFSNDGAEHSIYDKLLDLKFTNIVENASKIIDSFAEGIHFSKTLVFNDDDTQELRCRGDVSCLYSNIWIENNFISNILCNGPYSCTTASVNIKNTKNTQIICNGTQSCSEMVIFIDSAISSDIELDCGVAGSCTNLQIDIVGNNNNVEINCIDINSCDGLYATVDASNYRNVKLNMFSYSNNITFANGFGFEELNVSTQYVECNTHNNWMQWNTSWTSPNQQMILSQYINNEFPCNGVKIECFENNITDIVSSCSMKYHINSNPINITAQSTRLVSECYWVELSDVFSVSCDGDCVSSPTQNPTVSPTAFPTKPTSNPTQFPTVEPTVDPTFDPTQDPTTNPTLYPTTEPTSDPTLDPTNVPTLDPTVEPTIDPTRDPTAYPTHDPTNEPTLDPTVDPTIDPSTNPTNDPTIDPTVSPSHAPTTPPSNAPSSPPTNTPSYSPTQVPSTPPTRAPTNAPSYSPSTAPTRLPTIDIDDAYNTFIIVEYEVHNLSVTNKQSIVANTIKSVGKMEEIIESNYFHAEVLRYEYFFVHILTINDKNVDDADISTNAADDAALSEYDLDINNIEHIPMSLNCRIECDVTDSGFIITTTYTDSFITGTQNGWRQYFENDNISFVVETDASTITAESKYDTETVTEVDRTALILAIFIVSIGLFISSLAFVYNKLSFTKVDNAAFFMPLLISLNIYDFMSDINLSAIVIATALMPQYASVMSLMFWLAVLSVVFILLPFSSNLWYAMRIRRQRTIKNNPAARAYFGTHLAQFILLCVFCAGTYPVLGLTSSRLFGLEIFDAGLLSSELHQLSKIKIRSTIYLENGPQLLIQVLYTVMTAEEGIQTATILAFVASLLSVVASVIIYQAQRDVSDEFVVEKYFIRLYDKAGISNEHRNIFKFCEGLKARLGEALCQVFNISNKSIEIGFVTMNEYGLIVHLQQQIYKEELDTLKTKLLSDSNFAMPSTGYVIDITPDMYIERLFDIHRMKILNAFVEHFGLSERKKECEVSYHKRIEDANVYDDNKTGNDIDVEGKDDLLVALKKKLSVMSRRNVVNPPHRMPTTTTSAPIGTDSEQELNDAKEEEKGEILEMTKIATTQNRITAYDHGDDELNRAFNKLQLNLQTQMKQQLELNLEKQLKQQLELKQEMQSQMKTFQRMIVQHMDDNGNNTNHSQDVTHVSISDDMQEMLAAAVSGNN